MGAEQLPSSPPQQAIPAPGESVPRREGDQA
jgi:hypothetical protein